jgi:hypothetical protein
MSELPNDENSRRVRFKRREELTQNVIDLLYDVGPEAALPYAEELAELLGEEGNDSRMAWCLIWEARDRLDKAVEVGERDVEYSLSQIEEAVSDCADRRIFIIMVEDLLVGYYFQADRYLQMDIPGAAKAMMLAARALSDRFNVPLDEEHQEFFDDLCSEDEP